LWIFHNFCPNFAQVENFAQILPKFCPNFAQFVNFSEILPNLRNLWIFHKFCPIFDRQKEANRENVLMATLRICKTIRVFPLKS
jgi:hypothetical protein